jgi:biopolymer transport protein ExbD
MNADEKSYDDINVTPMVDLYLVLLLIFIIMTTASVQGLKVNLPKASSAPTITDKKPLSITINATGGILVDKSTTPSPLPELESRIAAWRAKFPDSAVILRGDGVTQYKNIWPVLDTLNRMGINQINLASEKP